MYATKFSSTERHLNHCIEIFFFFSFFILRVKIIINVKAFVVRLKIFLLGWMAFILKSLYFLSVVSVLVGMCNPMKKCETSSFKYINETYLFPEPLTLSFASKIIF